MNAHLSQQKFLGRTKLRSQACKTFHEPAECVCTCKRSSCKIRRILYHAWSCLQFLLTYAHPCSRTEQTRFFPSQVLLTLPRGWHGAMRRELRSCISRQLPCGGLRGLRGLQGLQGLRTDLGFWICMLIDTILGVSRSWLTEGTCKPCKVPCTPERSLDSFPLQC